MEQPRLSEPQYEEEQATQSSAEEDPMFQQEKNAVSDAEQEKQEEMERWAKNREKLKIQLFDRINGEAICQRIVSELTQEGLFELDEYDSSKVFHSSSIQDMRENKAVAKALRELAAQLPEGEEKSVALEYASDHMASNAFTETKLSSQASRKDARHKADYGVPTVESQTLLLEDFRRFGVIDSEEFEAQMQQLSAELQEQIND